MAGPSYAQRAPIGAQGYANPFGQQVALTIEVEGLEQTIGWFDRFNVELIKRLTEIINRTCREVEGEAVSRAPWFSGKLGRSISTRAAWHSDKGYTPAADDLQRVVRAAAKHGVLVEFGIGPLGVSTAPSQPDWLKRNLGNHMADARGRYTASKAKIEGEWKLVGGKPMYTALHRWAVKMGLPPWKVALGIKRRGGVKARPFLGPAWEAVKPVFIQRVERVLMEAATGPVGGAAI